MTEYDNQKFSTLNFVNFKHRSNSWTTAKQIQLVQCYKNSKHAAVYVSKPQFIKHKCNT